MLQDSTKSNIVRIMSIIILTVVACLGLYSAATSYLDYNSEKVQVEGTITSSEVDEDSSRRGVSYSADIDYEYEYKGQAYENDNLKPGLGSISMSSSEAESLVSEYPEGDKTTVYIDEDDPSSSWLIDELPIASIAISLIFGLSALFIMFKTRILPLVSQ